MMKKILAIIMTVFLLTGTVDAGKYGNGAKAPTPTRSVPVRPPSTPSPSQKPSSPSYKPSAPAQNNSNIGSKPKPSGNSYDSSAADAKRKEDSQRAWETGQRAKAEQAAKAKADAQKATYSSTSSYVPPKTNVAPPVYHTPNGSVRTVNDTQASYLKGRLDESRLQHRDDRYHSFYGSRYSYYNSRPVVYYDDHYSSSFWWYLRDQNYHTQALYAYNHRYEMDERRYLDLIAIAGVASEISYLESQRTARNPFWAPSGMDYDLMCNDTYVQSVYHYNPSVAPVVVVSGNGFWHFCVWLFWIGVVVVVIVVGLAILNRETD